MTNAEVYQGFHDDKKVEDHWLRYKIMALFHLTQWQNRIIYGGEY